MSLKEAPYYWYECDGCGKRSTEGSDYAAWGTIGDANDDAMNNAEWAMDIDGKDYCWTCSPFPMCAECGHKDARTEHDGDTWCDECIVLVAEDADEETIEP